MFSFSIDVRNNLEATYGQIDGCLSQLPNKCARNPGTSVGDRLKIYPGGASRVEGQPIISYLIGRTSLCPYGLPTAGSYGYSLMGYSQHLLLGDARYRFS